MAEAPSRLLEALPSNGSAPSATLDDLRKHDYVLTPGRYVGAAEQEGDGEPFAEKMARPAAQWREQRAEAAQLRGQSGGLGRFQRRVEFSLGTRSILNAAFNKWLIAVHDEHTSLWRDKQGEKPATIKMRKPKPLSG